jgi:hypothetical protein
MTRKKKTSNKSIEQYDHKGKKRVNNQTVVLVTLDTDKKMLGVVSRIVNIMT